MLEHVKVKGFNWSKTEWISMLRAPEAVVCTSIPLSGSVLDRRSELLRAIVAPGMTPAVYRDLEPQSVMFPHGNECAASKTREVPQVERTHWSNRVSRDLRTLSCSNRTSGSQSPASPGRVCVRCWHREAMTVRADIRRQTRVTYAPGTYRSPQDHRA